MPLGYSPGISTWSAPHCCAARMQAALSAGLSERQYNTTQAVAKIPDEKFEAAIEQPKPATHCF